MASTTTVPDFCLGDTVEMFLPAYRDIQKIWHVWHYNELRDMLTLTSNADGTGWMPNVHTTSVKLVSRGNLFKHLFGFPLEFADLTEETLFWIRTGEIKTVTNPANLNLVWSLDQAIKALSEGRVDAFQPFDPLFAPSGGHFYVYKAANPEIGRRLRQPSLNRLQAVKHSLKAK